MHCHYLVCVEDAQLGMPEVTLPVVPGMEGCHWPFRKTGPEDWPKLLQLLLTGKPVSAKEATGWLIDYAGPMEESLQTAWQIATDGAHGLSKRELHEGALEDVPTEIAGVPTSDNPALEAARKAIMDTIQHACGSPLAEALTVQAKHSAGFMADAHCKNGRIGAEFTKTMAV